MGTHIDLNADMGEYADEEQQAVEQALMPLITSCSIACGGHAGDEKTMRATARLARKHNVGVGAHPSYPDREGFGRRRLTLLLETLRTAINEQVASLKHILDEEGIPLRHIKPHGALYNEAANDVALADMIADAAGDAILVGPPGSALERAARDKGLCFAAEGFVDRLYLASGGLTPRNQPGAVIENIETRAAQALTLARNESLTVKGGVLKLCVDTLCVHSDSPGAVETAKAVRSRLEANGVAIKAFERNK